MCVFFSVHVTILHIYLSFQVGSVQAFEMRPYMDLLMHLMLISDSIQRHRLLSCLRGRALGGHYLGLCIGLRNEQ